MGHVAPYRTANCSRRLRCGEALYPDLTSVRKFGISEGQQTKAEMVYQYLTGPRFRQRVEAIVEAFSSMQEDLDKERKAIKKQWAKRDEQIERVMGATVGMSGDLQGIAGKSLREIEGLELEGPGFDAERALK